MEREWEMESGGEREAEGEGLEDRVGEGERGNGEGVKVSGKQRRERVREIDKSLLFDSVRAIAVCVM